MIELSDNTIQIIKSLFSEDDQNQVEELLKMECGDNIPFCENYDKHQMERIRFSVLKLSGGSIEKLIEGIELAQTDRRDLLMAAGFGENADAHSKRKP